MKKFITTMAAIVAVTMIANPVFAQTDNLPVYATGTITVPASATNTTVYPTGLALVGKDGVQSYRKLEEFMVKNQSGTATGHVFVVSRDLGVETSIDSYATLLPSTSTNSNPTVSWTKESTAGWIVTNDVPIEVTSTLTGYKRPTFRELAITVTNLPSATASTFWYMIKAE